MTLVTYHISKYYFSKTKAKVKMQIKFFRKLSFIAFFSFTKLYALCFDKNWVTDLSEQMIKSKLTKHLSVYIPSVTSLDKNDFFKVLFKKFSIFIIDQDFKKLTSNEPSKFFTSHPLYLILDYGHYSNKTMRFERVTEII